MKATNVSKLPDVSAVSVLSLSVAWLLGQITHYLSSIFLAVCQRGIVIWCQHSSASKVNRSQLPSMRHGQRSRLHFSQVPSSLMLLSAVDLCWHHLKGMTTAEGQRNARLQVKKHTCSISVKTMFFSRALPCNLHVVKRLGWCRCEIHWKKWNANVRGEHVSCKDSSITPIHVTWT